MKVVCKILLGLTLLQRMAYAADEPKIDVVDGKISISAQAVPLGRFLKLFDRAMGLNSEVKAGLENQNISVQFTDLNFNDAIRKIFQGQPLNYVVVEGKGIKVTDRAQGGTSTGVSDPLPVTNTFQPVNSPFQPIQPNPQFNPVQPAANIFGSPAPAAANPNANNNANNNANPNANPSAPLTGPGVMPPPLGSNVPFGAGNPLINPILGTATGGNTLPGTGTPAPSQPAAPGALPGAAPGTVK